MLLPKIMNSIFIIVLLYMLLKITQICLDKCLKIRKNTTSYEITLISVLSSVSYYIVLIVAIILILREFEILNSSNIGTLVTGASIVGLVGGFAAQSILKDIFNGFLILFEKQIHVGDFVIINETFRGTVEEIGIRSTSLRDWHLKRITIPNGRIISIQNYSKKRMRVVVHVRVAYEENPDNVINSLQEVCDILNTEHNENIYKYFTKESKNKFSVYGVTDIEERPTGAQYTITGVVWPSKYFVAQKEAKLQILKIFSKNGIKIAYPHYINATNQEIMDMEDGIDGLN